jgi:DNA-binding MarR family transcriptional regulator
MSDETHSDQAKITTVGQSGHKEKLEAIEAAIVGVRLLFHRLTNVAGEVHKEGYWSAGRRNILRDLARLGPQTVPQLARPRAVSRQLIQTVMNGLLRDGYVERQSNSAHARSHLMALTDSGIEQVKAMAEREVPLLIQATEGITTESLLEIAHVLHELRERFEGPRWQQILNEQIDEELE